MTFSADATPPANPRAARELLLDALRYELLGPARPEEVLDENPVSRYTVGMLAPFGTDVAPEEQEDSPGEDEGEDLAGAPELAPPLSQALSPSSIGLSCLLKRETTMLSAAVSWGQYERIPSEEATEDGEAEDDGAEPAAVEGDGSTRTRPRRGDGAGASGGSAVARSPAAFEVNLVPDAGLQRVRILPDDEIWVEHVSRSLDDGRQAVSVFLVNRRARPIRGRPSADTWLSSPASLSPAHPRRMHSCPGSWSPRLRAPIATWRPMHFSTATGESSRSATDARWTGR